MRFTRLITICIFSFLGCVSKERVNMSSKQNLHSIAEFRNALSSRLTPEHTRELFGPPNRDLGSGLYIYEYLVKEGGTIWLSFDSKLRDATLNSIAGEEKLFKKDVDSSDFFMSEAEKKSFEDAFQDYLAALGDKDKENIPKELRQYLLSYTKGLSGSFGGWHLDKQNSTWTLVRWHVISAAARVAAKIQVVKSPQKWSFEKPSFVRAKVLGQTP